MANKSKLIVEQDEAAPVEKKVLAKAIVDISESMRRLERSGLNRKAVVILVAKSANCPQYVVENVLDALRQLQQDYTNL